MTIDSNLSQASEPDKIYARLRSVLEGGAFEIGDMFPTETDLCAQYDVSRYALREALKKLEQEGYLSRRRGAGTHVLSTKPNTGVFHHRVGSSGDLELFARGTRIRFEGCEVIETDAMLARDLGCDELRRWYKLEGIRYDGDRPFGLTTLYLDASRISAPNPRQFDHEPVYRWMEGAADLKIAGVSQDISAVLLSERQAETFGETAGAPALQIARRYFDTGNQIFEIAITVHRSTDFVHNMRIKFDT